ncbi:MAG TPA: helix-turn-helix transcriptional regulator [Egibacteraceae bacterium]|nr:helix-turn-helix transcriptional regulator [Egibacteraceae bacterium]
MADRGDAAVGARGAARLLGRSGERQAVATFLADIRRGSRVVVVVGEVGMGKTLLWAHAVERAAAGGHRVLAARAAADESKLAYTLLIDLLEPVLDASRGLAEPLRVALETALLRRGSADGHRTDDEGAVARGVLAMLRTLSEQAPVTVAVDDLHLADVESRRALTFALRRLQAEPIGVFATLREQADAAGLETRAGRHPSDVLTLGPLEREAFIDVVCAHAISQPTLSTIEHLGVATGWNPGAALLIAEEMHRRGDPPLRPDRFPIPEVLARPFTHELDALPQTTQELLLIAACMSHPTLAEMEAASGHAAAGADGIDPAMARGLVSVTNERVRFAHPILPSVICSRATLRQRRKANERLGQAVVNPDEQVRHEALAATSVDAALADRLTQAGRRAAARGAMSLAVDHLTRAVRFTPSDQRSAATQRRILAARYHRGVGDVRSARPLLEQAAAGATPGADRAEALLALAELRRDGGELGAAVTLLVLAAEEATDTPALASTISRELAWMQLLSGDARSARCRAAEALIEARRSGQGAALAGSLTLSATLARVTRGRGRPDQLERAAGSARDAALPIAVSHDVEAARCHAAAGRFEAGRAGLEALHRRLLLRGRDDELPYLLGHLATLECRAARWDMALTYSSEGMAVARRCGLRLIEPWLLHAEAFARGCLGQHPEARAAAEAGLRLATEQGVAWWAWRNRWVQGFIALSEGDLQAAAQALVPVQRAAREAGVVDVDETPWSTDAFEALIGLGELEAAEQALTDHENLLALQDRPVANLIADRSRGLLAAAVGDRPEALTCLERSTKGLERLETPFELARSLVALGMIQRRDRKPAAASAALTEAAAIFRRFGATVWADRTRAEFPQTESGSTGPLTPTERRIASLAADGRTNKEISALVYASPKTVESHLSRVYRKLGIRSRAELGRALER